MVKAKKHLGQHFLKEPRIAEKIANLIANSSVDKWLEIGPGTGVLTKFLLPLCQEVKCVELDTESVEYLAESFPNLAVINSDFLHLNFKDVWPTEFGIIGNFPYNISTQIVFHILENRAQIPEFAGMFQLEVAQRIASEPHSKTYGILSVLTQAFYEVDLVFKVGPGNFNPPPKVQSGVLKAQRKENFELSCNERLLFRVVKAAFGQRRKTLSNSLKIFKLPKEEVLRKQIFKLRAENLDVQEFINLTNWIEEHQ